LGADGIFVARERYGMLRDGEFGYQIIREDEP
jgi:cell division protein FtsB